MIILPRGESFHDYFTRKRRFHDFVTRLLSGVEFATFRARSRGPVGGIETVRHVDSTSIYRLAVRLQKLHFTFVTEMVYHSQHFAIFTIHIL